MKGCAERRALSLPAAHAAALSRYSRDTGNVRSYPSEVVGEFFARMAPVPGFDARGFLPPYMGDDGTTGDRSPYVATMTEVVTAFATTNARRKLLKGLLEYRALLISLGYDTGVQFVDGSFVEDVELREARDPGDVDVFSLLQRPDQYQEDPHLWLSTGLSEWQSQIIDHVENKKRFGIDTYAVALDQCDLNDVISVVGYWYSLFSHKRVTQDWKGFLRIALDASDDAAARELLVSNNA
jgi:hypothetical protein